jgi:N-acetylmuramoyl-L-alanine amidase
MLALFILCADCLAAVSVEVTGSSVATSKKYTRLVLNLSAPPIDVKVGEGEKSLVITLPGCESKITDKFSGEGVIKGISFKSVSQGLNVTVSLKTDTAYQLYQLPKYLNRPHRLVVNFSNPREQIDNIFNKLAGNRKIVVIDPGHGGKDPGAVGPSGLCEKDVVLDVASRAFEILSKEDDFSCYLSRSGDEYVKLEERVGISRGSGADLFVSIHCNASNSKSAAGVEVFYLSDNKATDAAAKLLATRENAALEIGIEASATEVDRSVLKILIDMKQNFVLKQSSVFAGHVLSRLSERLSNVNRGVRRAGFAVLKAVAVPSVLIELAFISNPKEEKLLKTTWYRQVCAQSIASAVRDFFKSSDQEAQVSSRKTGDGKGPDSL